MALEKALSMEQIRPKLKNLRKIMPDQLDIVYDFASYLADRISDELVPECFYKTSRLVIWDLQHGTSVSLNMPIPNKLAGYSPQTYAVLGMYITPIAEAVCPQEFAEDVKIVEEAIRKYEKVKPRW